MQFIDTQSVSILDDKNTDTLPKSVAQLRATDLAAVSDRPTADIEAEILAGNNTESAKAKQQATKFDFTKLNPEDDVQGKYNQFVEKAGDVQGAAAFYIEQAMALEDDNFNAPLARHITNISVAREVFQEEMEKAWDDPSTLGLINDWIDYNLWRYVPIGMVEALTNRTERKGGELLANSLEMDTESYRAYIREYVKELKEEGVFESDNFFALSQGMEEISTLGEDPDQLGKQLFAVVDIAGLSAGTALKLARLAKMGPAGKTAALRGPEEATEIARKLKGTPTASHGASVSPGTLRLTDDMVAVRGTLDKDSVSETITERLQRQYDEGLLFEAPDKESLIELQLEQAKALSDTINRQLIHTELKPIGFGNYNSVIQVGRVDGKPFKSKRSAQRLAAIEGQGEVVELPTGGWVLQFEETVDTSKAIEGISVEQSHKTTLGNIYSKTFGASTQRQSDKLRAHSFNSEAVSSKLSVELQAELDIAFKPLKTTEAQSLDQVLTQLRDGEHAGRRTWYNQAEFSSIYKTIHGTAPTKQVLNAYDKIVEASDAAWTVDAHFYLQQAIRRGQRAIDTGGKYRVMGSPVSNVEKTDKVYDASQRKVVNGSEVSGDVWRVDDDIMGAKLVTNPISVRNPELEHVLPYNAGGFRNNVYSRYFVGSEDNSDFRALLGAFSRKQVDKAVEELGVLSQALKSGLSGKKLDDIIAQNNSWNPSVETTGDLDQLSKKTGYDFSKTPVFKERDQKIIGGNNDGATFGQEQRRQANYNRKRANGVLLQYGGDTNVNLSPSLSIAQQLSKSADRFAHKHYTDAATVGWVKAAQAKGILESPSGISKNDYYRHFMEGKINGSGLEADVLKNQRAIIQRRLNISPTKDSLEGSWEGILNSASEFIFDASRGKIRTDLAAKDGSAQLMKLGFLSKFGFFNPAQFMIQSQQVMSIMAISPKHGVKAAGIVPAFRLALNAPSESGRRLAVKRMSEFLGQDKNFIQEVFDNVILSGRHILSHDIVELAEGSSSKARLGRSKPISDTLDKSTVFFREGELMARLTGIITASMEYAAKNPGKSLKTNIARAWISNREQTLTFNMTTASRSAGQSGFMRVPTQWLTFTLRAFEAVAVGNKGLSAAERFRLGLALGPVWGVTGITIPHVFNNDTMASDMAEYLTGSSDNTELVKTLQYGLIDSMIRWSTGADTALADRLAPSSGLGDFLEKLFNPESDQSFVGVLLGPSGEITGSAIDAGLKSMAHLFGGAPAISYVDLETAYRNISTLDNIHKAVGIWKYSTYRTKGAKAVDTELDRLDAVLQGMGFTSMEVLEYYRLNGSLYRTKKYQDKWFKDHVRPYTRKIREVLEEGDNQGAVTLAKQLDALIQTSGLNPTAQAAIRRRMVDDSPEMMSLLWKRAFDLGIAEDVESSFDIIEGR